MLRCREGPQEGRRSSRGVAVVGSQKDEECFRKEINNICQKTEYVEELETMGFEWEASGDPVESTFTSGLHEK